MRIVPQKGPSSRRCRCRKSTTSSISGPFSNPGFSPLRRRSCRRRIFAALDALQARFVAATGAGDTSQYGTLNAALHQALYVHAAMPRTAQIVAALLQTSDRYTRLQLSTPEAMARAVREHAELIALCRRARSRRR